jgi:thioredoxin reductase (NADPH)
MAKQPTKNHGFIIVGAGPAGLSAATYGASERLDTAVLETREQTGGQAATSSLIENYAGFPRGISGPELMGRMAAQASRMGAELYTTKPVEGIERTDRGLEISTSEGGLLVAKNVLLANGVQYNKHPAEGLDDFIGRGVHYGSPNLSAKYENEELFIVGGANSAGQAAVALSECKGCTVHMLVRGSSLEDSMSGYLIDKITGKSNIVVHFGVTLEAVDGGAKLEKVILSANDTNVATEMRADEVFVMIGASPRTGWLPEEIHKDDAGFVVTGGTLDREKRDEFEDTHERPPLAQETTMEGVFAAGDIQSGSQKRVASAVGSGANAVGDIHKRNSFIESHSTKIKV